MSRRMVCQLGGSLRYHMCTHPVDMRKSFHGLVGIVQQEFGRQLSPDDVYVFYGKNRRTLKMLHREGNGLTLYTRKLDGVCFPKLYLDENRNECVISYATFALLALGDRMAVKKLSFGCI